MGQNCKNIIIKKNIKHMKRAIKIERLNWIKKLNEIKCIWMKLKKS
jgi:hypothetical protein